MARMTRLSGCPKAQTELEFDRGECTLDAAAFCVLVVHVAIVYETVGRPNGTSPEWTGIGSMVRSRYQSSVIVLRMRAVNVVGTALIRRLQSVKMSRRRFVWDAGRSRIDTTSVVPTQKKVQLVIRIHAQNSMADCVYGRGYPYGPRMSFVSICGETGGPSRQVWNECHCNFSHARAEKP